MIQRHEWWVSFVIGIAVRSVINWRHLKLWLSLRNSRFSHSCWYLLQFIVTKLFHIFVLDYENVIGSQFGVQQTEHCFHRATSLLWSRWAYRTALMSNFTEDINFRLLQNFLSVTTCRVLEGFTTSFRGPFVLGQRRKSAKKKLALKVFDCLGSCKTTLNLSSRPLS